MPTALICGITGQDGAYLARQLLARGYTVHGTSRDPQLADVSGLERVGVHDRVHIHSVTITDFRSVLQTLDSVRPDEIYNLAGQSSVGLSFELPVETMESLLTGTLTLLEAVRFLGLPARFYNAGSGECYGNTGAEPADESTPFRPRSPYAVAKAAAFWAVANYREAYRIHACTGILFNHESPLRHPRFVTRKITTAACRIAAGSGETLALGDLRVERDWGWAPEYTDAMWRLLQTDQPMDLVIATGATRTLQEFVATAFAEVGLDWRDHVITDAGLLRPADIMSARANPARAARTLGWQATHRMPDVVRAMIAAEREAAGGRPSARMQAVHP